MVFLFCLGFIGPVSADTITWNNSAGGSWNVPENWSPQQVPGTSDTAVINGTDTYTVVVTGTQSISELVMDNPNATLNVADEATFFLSSLGTWTHRGGGVAGTGTIVLSSNCTLELEEDFSVDGPGVEGQTLTVNGPGRFRLGPGPETTRLVNLTVNADFEFDRDLGVVGLWYLNGAFGVPAGRTLKIVDNAGLFLANGFENHGTIILGNETNFNITTSIYISSGTLTNAVGGVFRVTKGTGGQFAQGGRSIFAELDNQGTFEVDFNVDLNGTGNGHRNSGTVSITEGVTLTVRELPLTNSSTGLFEGTGTLSLTQAATFTNDGTLSPGLSPGTLTVTGDYPQSADAVLDLEIGGFAPGTEHDVLAVSGAAALDGTVRATLIDDFFPKKDDAFTVLTYASRTGEFTALDNPLPERIAWEVQYGATSAQLVVLNTAPTLAAIDNQTVNEETLFSLTASATDMDLPAQTMTYSLDEAPSGMTINPTSGLITWTPTEAQGPGSFDVTVRVTDSGTPALGHTTSFSVSVNEVNVAPQLALPGAQSGNELTELVFIVNATDADLPANALTYEMVSGPEGATFNPATREFRWTPTEAHGPGSFAATFRVTDNNPDAVNDKQLSAEGMVNITINEVNLPPALAGINNQTADEETALSFTVTATDPDFPTNGLAYSLDVAPSGMTIDPATGEITWTPTEAQGPGNHDVTVRVTDNGAPALGHTTSFSVTVNEVNLAPTMTLVANAVVHAGTPFSTVLSATDPDEPANSFTYSLATGPVGATVSPTGLVNWTPPLTDAGSLADFTVRVTDNGSPAQSNDRSFQVTVTEALEISAIVQTGDELEFIWSAIPGRVYRLITSGTLPAIEWSPVSGDVPATGGTASKTVTIDAEVAFFQVELVD